MRKDFLAIKIRSMIVIAPEIKQIKTVWRALELIKKVDKKEYNNLFSRINAIFITRHRGGVNTNEFFMPEKIWFTDKSEINGRRIKSLAGAILHEGYHATQFKNGKYVLSFGEKLEKPAIRFQIKFLKKLKHDSEIQHLRLSFENKYWREMDEDILSHDHFDNLLNLFGANKLQIKFIKKSALNADFLIFYPIFLFRFVNFIFFRVFFREECCIGNF